MLRYQLVKLIAVDREFNQTDDIDRAIKSAVTYLQDSGAEGVFYLVDARTPAAELVASLKSEVEVSK